MHPLFPRRERKREKRLIDLRNFSNPLWEKGKSHPLLATNALATRINVTEEGEGEIKRGSVMLGGRLSIQSGRIAISLMICNRKRKEKDELEI